MQEILGKLNRSQGVQGSLIVNKDGIVVASDFSIDIDDQGVGAVASSILTSLDGAIKHIKIGKLKRFVVNGDENKIVIIDAGPALLLVLLAAEVNMGLINVELATASAEVVEKAKI